MQTLDYDTQPTTAEHVSDAAITAAVELFFLTKKGVPAHLIDVSIQAGIVQLSGITDNLRTLLGELAPNDLGLVPRPYPRPQLLGLVLDFVENNRIPTWQKR